MNKTELIEALAPRLGGRTQAAAAVEAVVDVVLREVAAGRSVGISGFGTFEKVDRAPRTGRNPRTGEAVPIAGTSTPRFRPGAYFKDVVADPSALPSEGLAGARVGSDGRLERTGAPSSVRRVGGLATEEAEGVPGQGEASRSTEDRNDGRDGDQVRDRGGRQPGKSRQGRTSGTSGTPDSVRKDADLRHGTTSAPGRSEAAVPATARVLTTGEEITQGMIWAEKAQLARVKKDELAAKQDKQARKAEKESRAAQSDDATGGGGRTKKRKGKEPVGQGGKGGKNPRVGNNGDGGGGQD